MSKKQLFLDTLNTIVGIVLLPLSLYSWIERRIIYLSLKRNLSPYLFNKLDAAFSAKAIYKNELSAINKAKILSSLNKNTAWGILLELEKIDKNQFFEILKCLDLSLLNDYLLLESLSRRKLISHALGINDNVSPRGEIDYKEDFSKTEKIKYGIEELYDLLPCLREDAEFLYSYSDPKNSASFFNSLSKNDQKRLIVLALALGDKKVLDVVHYLSPAHKKIEELLEEIPLVDRSELEGIVTQFKSVSDHQSFSNDHQRISVELDKACKQMAPLTVEEAFWVLIPKVSTEAAIWIEAVGKGEDDFLSKVRLPSQVIYDPNKEARHKLITAMRRTNWILHVHNHPKSSRAIFGSSSHDRAFAQHWKSYRPELSNKMKFFIIQEGKILEYSKEEA